MRDQLRALVKLSEIDVRTRGVTDQLKALPSELEARRSAVAQLEALVAKQKQLVDDAEKLLAQQEESLTQRNDALSKAKAKGAKASNAREAEAADKELEAVRRAIRDGEGERDRLRERIASTKATLDAPSATLEEAKAELTAEESVLQPRLQALETELASISKGREEWAAKVDKLQLRLYERLRVKISPAVCPTRANGTCSVCSMQVPAQRFVEMMKGTEIFQCQHCVRILYAPEALAD